MARRPLLRTDYARRTRLAQRSKQTSDRLKDELTLRGLPRSYTELPESERFSDAGDAALVEALSGDTLRHVSAWGWLAYHHGRWDDEDGKKLCERAVEGALHHLALGTVGILGTDEGRRLASHLHVAFNRVDAITRAAAWREKLSARPEVFDAKPTYLNVADCVVDLTNGNRYDHHPDFYLSKQTSASYSKETAEDVQKAAQGDQAAVARVEALAPTWQTFLRTVFVHPNRAPDEALIRYMQDALGYTLTSSTDEQAMFILHGGGKNGKSTLLNVLLKTLGSHATTVKPEVLVHQGASYRGENSPDPELAKLAGVRLVTSVEPSDADGKGKLDVARVKQLTGKDPISVRKLHHAPFTLIPEFKLFLATNNKPKVEEDTEGTWRRLKLIPFNARFTPGEPGHIPDMEEKLLKEKDGILAWLMVGALRFNAKGRLGDPPQSVAEATRTFHHEQAPFAGFFEDEVARDPEGVTPLDEAHKRFVAWVKRNEDDVREALGIEDTHNGYPMRYTPPNKAKFATMCAGQNYTKKRRTKGNVLLGMRLRTADEQLAAVDDPDTAARAGDGAEDVGECSKTPLYTEYPIDDSYKEICVTPPFATSTYIEPTADAGDPPSPPPIGDPPASPSAGCAHLHITVGGGKASCDDCGRRWASADEIPSCAHTERVDGRCVVCGWQVERVPVGGCKHPVAQLGEGFCEGTVICPHCADVDEWLDRGGLHGGRFTCRDPEAHRADWDALGCPHCWEQPYAPRRWVVETLDSLSPVTPLARPWEQATGVTWEDAYHLLPTCPIPAHKRETRSDHHASRCAYSRLATGVTPPKLPGGEALFTRDDAGRVTGAHGLDAPFAREMTAALALSQGLTITDDLQQALDTYQERAEVEAVRAACAHDLDYRATVTQGHTRKSVCSLCGADMRMRGGYR